MDLKRIVDHALSVREDISAIACIDAESGMVISAAIRDSARDLDALEGMTAVASCALDLCAMESGETGDETIVVGPEWIHVMVRAPAHPELVVVGLAPAASNLALLASCTRDVAHALRR